MVTRGTALGRIWRRVLQNPRQALESTLSPTDLQTLLLAVADSRANRRTAADLMRGWRENRYVQPAMADRRLVARVEGRLWELLPEAFAGVELSPVTPLGTCSVVAAVDQNRVLSTVRGTEVVGDLTNALAIDAACRRRDTRAPTVHLAACHRVLRMQRFPPPYAQHFRLFALVSTTRDTGGGRAEAQLLTDHLRFWTRALPQIAAQVDFQLQLSVTERQRSANGSRTPFSRPCSPSRRKSQCATTCRANKAAATTQPQPSESLPQQAARRSRWATADSQAGRRNCSRTRRNDASSPVSRPSASARCQQRPEPGVPHSALSDVAGPQLPSLATDFTCLRPS